MALQFDKKNKMDDDNTFVHKLNDDCLFHIFKLLPVPDLFNVELVCLRWRYLCILIFKSIKRLDAAEWNWYSDLRESNESKRFEIFKKLFVRCRQNLTTINLARKYFATDRMIPLAISRNRWWSEKNFKDFMIHSGDIKKILYSCNNIEILALDSYYYSYDFLIELFERNNKIRSLYILGIKHSISFLHKLPVTLKDLRILTEGLDCHKDLSSSLGHLVNLDTLSIYSKHFGTGFIDFVSKTFKEKLKSLELMSSEYARCYETDFNQISQLKNLRILSLEGSYVTDDALKNILVNCNRISALRMKDNRRITNKGLSGITDLPRLIALECSWQFHIRPIRFLQLPLTLRVLILAGNEFTDEELSRTLRSLELLEKLDISHCNGITNNFVEFASNLTRSRSNKIVLEIAFRGTKIDMKSIQNTSPLLKFSYELNLNYRDYLLSSLCDS